MINGEISSERPADSQLSLPRVHAITHLTKFLRKPRSSRRTIYSLANSFTVPARSEENDSDNSQVLYMADPKLNRRCSLSSFSNGPDRKLDGPADGKVEDKDEDEQREASWSIVDREIYEWQYVCKTGRPYCWSPDSKYARVRKLQPRLANNPYASIFNWSKQADNTPSMMYAERHRALTNSFIADPSIVDDVAQLVAVQLLGACFTLPPEDSIGLPSPNYASVAKLLNQDIPDPRMISSLRMHTHFRYSPCFGHQARSPSPVQHELALRGAFDGHTRSPSTPPTQNSGLLVSEMEGLSAASRHDRIRQILEARDTPRVGTSYKHVRRTSDPVGSFSRQGESIRSHQRCTNADSRLMRTNLELKEYPQAFSAHSSYLPRIEATGRKRSRQATSDEEELHLREEAHHIDTQKSNYQLHSVIRSEPHHVFVQPVKELVVKRWKKLRRRLSGRGSQQPSTASVDPSASKSSSGVISNTTISPDGKKRRKRARESGDIQSITKPNPPLFKALSNGIRQPAASGNLPPSQNRNKYPRSNKLFILEPLALDTKFKILEPPVATTATAVADSRLVCNVQKPSTAAAISQQNSSPLSDIIDFAFAIDRTPSIPRSEALATCGTEHSGSEFPTFPMPPRSPIVSAYEDIFPLKCSPRNGPASKRRKSTLSEVYTAGYYSLESVDSDTSELVARGILSEAGSRMGTPREEMPLLIFSQPGLIDTETVEVQSSRRHSTSTAEDSQGSGVMEQDGRPKLERMSTNGTQIFTTSLEGVEIDGIPAGPGREMWDTKGKGKERTYL